MALVGGPLIAGRGEVPGPLLDNIVELATHVSDTWSAYGSLNSDANRIAAYANQFKLLLGKLVGDWKLTEDEEKWLKLQVEEPIMHIHERSRFLEEECNSLLKSTTKVGKFLAAPHYAKKLKEIKASFEEVLQKVDEAREKFQRRERILPYLLIDNIAARAFWGRYHGKEWSIKFAQLVLTYNYEASCKWPPGATPEQPAGGPEWQAYKRLNFNDRQAFLYAICHDEGDDVFPKKLNEDEVDITCLRFIDFCTKYGWPFMPEDLPRPPKFYHNASRKSSSGHSHEEGGSGAERLRAVEHTADAESAQGTLLYGVANQSTGLLCFEIPFPSSFCLPSGLAVELVARLLSPTVSKAIKPRIYAVGLSKCVFAIGAFQKLGASDCIRGGIPEFISKGTQRTGTLDNLSGENGWEFDVFVSHAGENKAFARDLVALLEMMDLRAFVDADSLHTGDNANVRIWSALRQAPLGVCVFDKYFFSKSWPVRELQVLVDQEKLLPIVLGLTYEELEDKMGHNQAHAENLQLRDEWRAFTERIARTTMHVAGPTNSDYVQLRQTICWDIVRVLATKTCSNLPDRKHAGRFQMRVKSAIKYIDRNFLKISREQANEANSWERLLL